MNEAEHRTDDADGRRVTAGRLKKFDTLFGVLFARAQINFHQFLDFLGINPIDGKGNCLFHEPVLVVLRVLFQRNDAVFPGLGGITANFADQGIILFRSGNEFLNILNGLNGGMQGKTDKSSAKGAAKDDQGRGWLDQGVQVQSFKGGTPNSVSYTHLTLPTNREV